MKRSPLGLDVIADWNNLAAAFYRAARGKTGRDEVRMFRATLNAELASLRQGILQGAVAPGSMRAFQIRDPKPRLIHAPCFRSRVLHHAIIAYVGPVLDRGLVADSFACRVGKGALAAVRRAQHHGRRFAWYGQIDIKSYFAEIDHGRLQAMLARRFKNRDLLALLGRIIADWPGSPGKGLPIGALPSQHFANAYLGALDRFLLEQCQARAMVRYMDDVVWWADDKATVITILKAVETFVGDELGLTIKDNVRIGRSRDGVNLCGYRVLTGGLLLSRRRKRRYVFARRSCETAFALGTIDSRALQAGYSAALAITAHTDSRTWRAAQICRHPVAGAVATI
jgi:RNA-directed DNA polymerase